jgi:hypothetical protein
VPLCGTFAFDPLLRHQSTNSLNALQLIRLVVCAPQFNPALAHQAISLPVVPQMGSN